MDRHAFSGALDSLNEAIVTYQSFLPAFLEKMKVQGAMRDWEQAVETAQRCGMQCGTCYIGITNSFHQFQFYQ